MVDTILTCYKYPVTLCAEPDTLMYQWTSNDPDLFIEFDTAACVDVIPRLDTTTVYANITDSLGIITCVDSVQIWLYPRMNFEEVNQINTGCPLTCKGQLQVIVSGGLPPYEYEWPTATPVQRDSIVFGLCEQEYQFTVEDQYMCVRDTMIPVEVFDMPEVEIVRDPEDDIYIQNPVVNFSFVNNSADSIQVIDWNWDFGDSTYTKEEAPDKVFDQVRDFDVWLKYTTDDECIDSVSMTVTIGEAELTVYNMISPNSDGNNDVFTIENLEYYISNKVKVFNRYGKRVFSADNYQNDWGGDNLREGVYFYTLEAVGYFRTENLQGSLTILR
jgi:gliding motility-associated-like protein